LVRPLPVAALLDAARADVEVAEALLIKQPPPIRRALSESKAEGRREGEKKGRRKGKAEGRREGELKTKAEAILKVLAKRGLEVSPEVRASIEASRHRAELDRWFDRAFSVKTAAEVMQKE